MPRDYFCVIQWDAYVSAEAAILDNSTKLFRYFDEAEDYAMSCAFAKAAALGLSPSAISKVKYPTGLVITVINSSDDIAQEPPWTCIVRAFLDV